MAKPHHFGGDWTERKLDIVKGYLYQYTRIFDKNEKAKFFHTVYVDAFAGTGSRVDSDRDPDKVAYLKGSAQIALEVEPSFKSYLFIEQDEQKVEDLKNLTSRFPNKTCKVVHGEANRVLNEWISSTDWKNTRAVVFLDPYGMQVDWQTIEAIAKTKGIDLWLLFPYSLLNRLLTKDEIPPDEWCEKLNKIFGTNEWMERFYSKVVDETLFGPEESIIKSAPMSYLKEFIVNRLQSVFYAVAQNPYELINSRNSPLFLLCFAAGNEKGSKPAINIASYLMKN